MSKAQDLNELINEARAYADVTAGVEDVAINHAVFVSHLAYLLNKPEEEQPSVTMRSIDLQGLKIIDRALDPKFLDDVADIIACNCGRVKMAKTLKALAQNQRDADRVVREAIEAKLKEVILPSSTFTDSANSIGINDGVVE